MKKALLIYNPKAGKNTDRPSLNEIVELFPVDEFDIKAVVTDPNGAAPVVCQFADGTDIIIVCGGDGTLNEAISGLMQTGLSVPIGYIPIGSTNDLANALNISGKLTDAVKLIRSGEIHTLDIGQLNDRFFNYVACFGPGTSVSYNTPQKLKNTIGYPAYILNGFILNLIPTIKAVKPKHIRMECDGKITESSYYFGAVSNATTVAGMIHYDENEIVLNDGMFEVILVKRINHKLDIFKILYKMMNRNYDDESFLYLKANNITLKFDNPEDWSVDGELASGLREARITVHEKAVQIFCPSSSMLK